MRGGLLGLGAGLFRLADLNFFWAVVCGIETEHSPSRESVGFPQGGERPIVLLCVFWPSGRLAVAYCADDLAILIDQRGIGIADNAVETTKRGTGGVRWNFKCNRSRRRSARALGIRGPADHVPARTEGAEDKGLTDCHLTTRMNIASGRLQLLAAIDSVPRWIAQRSWYFDWSAGTCAKERRPSEAKIVRGYARSRGLIAGSIGGRRQRWAVRPGFNSLGKVENESYGFGVCPRCCIAHHNRHLEGIRISMRRIGVFGEPTAKRRLEGVNFLLELLPRLFVVGLGRPHGERLASG